MKVMLLFLTVILYIGISGCSSNKKIINEKTVIPPGVCRIKAEVVKIDSTLLGGTNNDPCSKAPCIAWIKVKNIIGYGAGSATVKNNDILKTKFAFTLSPTTKELFPTLKEQLPGLAVGSLFVADIQLLPNILSGAKKEKIYLVYSYKKTN